MVSHMYPNVNKHIFSQLPVLLGEQSAATRSSSSSTSTNTTDHRPAQQLESLVESDLDPESSESSSSPLPESVLLACRPRTSAPPPYSEADPIEAAPYYQHEDPSSSSNNKKNAKKATPTSSSLLLEVAVGHRLAQVITKKRQDKKAARLEQVHDAWAKLGLNTRLISAQGGELPPHFWSPPRCSAQELNAELAKLCL